MSDATIGLIRDLTERLGAMAAEFGDRVAALPQDGDAAADDRSEEALTRRAKQALAERKARRRFFPGELFHEPAWDMLIGLFITRADPQPIHVKVLATFADAPVTTSQRWIDQLFRLGLVTRTIDPVDRRRIEVALSEAGIVAMIAYLSALPPVV